MRARDLAVGYKMVSVDSDVMDAARLMADRNLPGLLVVDERGGPQAVLPASQVVKALVPGYVIEDPTLAAVVDEKHADRLCRALAGRRVGDFLPREATPPPVVDPDDTALEVAALMARVHSPLVAVAEKNGTGPDRRKPESGRLLGVITASHLLQELLRAGGALDKD
ncbi:CBS domain-containing protein [Streptomyces odontomachi]|uniref:CBS domain-containing protein n=1 Tax=Streptomyces odontomachi TaxID=2944940 RepID=UPI00210CBB49|nr:CBS domain-containing protein [Streptomyces sp. ODS25]